MKKDIIISEICKIVSDGKWWLPASIDNYSHWTIGITDDLDRQNQEHEMNGKNVTCWYDWPADTVRIARAVEKYFTDRRMNGDTGGGQNPTYVYIF